VNGSKLHQSIKDRLLLDMAFDSNLSQIVVIIPTLNEESSIGKLIDGIVSLNENISILIVDDSSDDNTAKNVEFKMREHSAKIELIVRERVCGIAGAYLAGYKWALVNGYETIVQMDADGQHDFRQIPMLIKQSANSHMVIGSRYLTSSNLHGWSKFRIVLSLGANVYFRLLHNVQIRDATSGMRCFRVSALYAAWIVPPISKGFCFHAETTHRFNKLGFGITEVAIDFFPRNSGKSKMNLLRTLESLRLFPRF